MKIIHDNIWGDIVVSDEALRWIDTEEFQRLHMIRQTGLAYRVFPTASCTRFAHSIGAYHVARMILRHLATDQKDEIERWSPQELEWICLAALLHDIGHGPFSHAFDVFLEESGYGEGVDWIHHETRSLDMIEWMEQRYDMGLGAEGVRFVQSLIEPKARSCDRTRGAWFEFLINNPDNGIDVDKMDYLVRDNHQFGLSMLIDIPRIVSSCRIIDNTLCFCNKVQTEIWNLFLIRHRLHSTIYRHPRIVRFEREIRSILARLRDESFDRMIIEKDVVGFTRWTDARVLVMASNTETIRAFHTRRNDEDKSRTTTPIAYHDSQFKKMLRIPFYDKGDCTTKFFLPLPSPFCPFSIPITSKE